MDKIANNSNLTGLLDAINQALCGYTMQKMALNVRSWVCPECGADHDRDVNAAKNIKAVGLTVLACGESVNPNAA